MAINKKIGDFKSWSSPYQYDTSDASIDTNMISPKLGNMLTYPGNSYYPVDNIKIPAYYENTKQYDEQLQTLLSFGKENSCGKKEIDLSCFYDDITQKNIYDNFGLCKYIDIKHVDLKNKNEFKYYFELPGVEPDTVKISASTKYNAINILCMSYITNSHLNLVHQFPQNCDISTLKMSLSCGVMKMIINTKKEEENKILKIKLSES